MNPHRYRKLFAAIVGLALIVALRYFEIDLMGLDPLVIDLVASAATAWGVYQVPNDYA